MSLEEFLHNLHFDINKVSPPDWEVDWEDAPLTYKLYRGLPVTPLSAEVPLSLDGKEEPNKLDLRGIGHFLWHVYGLNQFSQTVFAADSSDEATESIQSCRRFVPSGGGLYPNELYIYLKVEELPTGVYHYDVAHHRLVLLREGDFDCYIASSLGNRSDMSACFGTVFITTMFWKNFYKYNNFSYRLQGLDAGVLIGQLLEVSKRFCFDSGVYFQFLDRAVNHLIGLTEQEESVYAVIPLSVETGFSTNVSSADGVVYADELSRELPTIHTDHYVKSRTVLEYPMLTKMNEASMLESTESFCPSVSEESSPYDSQSLALPRMNRLSYDLSAICRKRFSPEMNFVLEKVSQSQLASLLQEAMSAFSYRNDLDGANLKKGSRVSLYGSFYNVEGIPNGAYYYDVASHSLQLIQSGDLRLPLQNGMSLDNVNLFQVPLCLHVSGNKGHYKKSLGYRGYRIQQMEAGMLVQRLLLAASAIGMGGHPLLGFDVNACDRIYKMESQRKTSLIQIPIGPYRQRAWLKGSLHN
ncbi:SagB family peptide dehydrogenase [Alkalihalobacillus sp. AL-G]|uniref:SagB family peptide dehydrogenase n=1 Tax=Alkalihalobacillus sp. AL-G TaxID=2926399 RepID=UPI00272A8CB0|nr:SagB family peptide dehydrogenase [Alkalihalobacillus sp. AL-G]WLD92823.1 SagB family peptide dehydrogenase [Alkalihalobacillus sp. AL-G]